MSIKQHAEAARRTDILIMTATTSLTELLFLVQTDAALMLENCRRALDFYSGQFGTERGAVDSIIVVENSDRDVSTLKRCHTSAVQPSELRS